MNIKITSKDGVTLNTANKYVGEDIAISLDESLLSGINPAVPISGYVDYIYFNIGLSIDEVISIIDDANLNYNANNNYEILFSGSGAGVFDIWVEKEDTSYKILKRIWGGESVIFFTSDSGWNPKFNGFVKVKRNIATSSEPEAGIKNKELVELTSIVPYHSNIKENLLQKKIDNDIYLGCVGLFADWLDSNLDETINALDTSKVQNMVNMFSGCYELNSLPEIDTSSCTKMSYMFSGCSALTSVSVTDTSKVTDMSDMFNNCLSLTSLQKLDTSSCNNMHYMFSRCINLTTIDISYYNISSAFNVSNFALDCTALKSLVIRGFGENYVLNTYSFQNSGITNGTGYIYVPSAMVDTLKSATNWSTYASQIRALEDYTIDGTTTGELDLTKI